MSKNTVIFCSGLDGKVKLVSGHERKPWVLYYLEQSHSIAVVDFATKCRLMQRSLKSIIEAAPILPSSTLHHSNGLALRTNDVVDILFPDGLAGPNGDTHDGKEDDSESVALLSELGEVRHLSFTDDSFSQSSTTASLHSESFVLIQTTNYLIFYDFLAHTTLFLSNLGSVLFRGKKYLGVAAGGRYGSSSSLRSSSKSGNNASSVSSSGNEAVGFNPTCSAFIDAGVLAVGCSDGSIRVWRLLNDISRCRESARWQAYKSEVACMRRIRQPGFECDFGSGALKGIWLCTVGGDGIGYVWSAYLPRTSSPLGDMVWHSLHDGVSSNSGSGTNALVGTSGTDAALIAPVARFSAPMAPAVGSILSYACATSCLSMILSDKNVFSVSLEPLFLRPNSSIFGVGAADIIGGRARTSPSGSDPQSQSSSSMRRSSFSAEGGSGIVKQHMASATVPGGRAHPPTPSADKKRGGLLSGVLGSGPLSRTFFSFMGGSSSTSTLAVSEVLFVTELGGAWCPVELSQSLLSKHRSRACVAALVGARGEVLLATKGSGTLLIMSANSCTRGNGIGGAGGTGTTASIEDLAPRDEWNVHAAVSSYLGFGQEPDPDDDSGSSGGIAVSGTGMVGSEKGIKVYAMALCCGPYLVLGTNRGVVAALYQTARVPNAVAVHSDWSFVLATSPTSGTAVCVSKVTLGATSDKTSSCGGSGSVEGMAVLQSTQVGHYIVTGDSSEDMLGTQLIPSVSGKFCCVLTPCSSRGYTYAILSTVDSLPLQEVARGNCTAFGWIGARDIFVLTTAVVVASAPTHKRSSLLSFSAVKGLLGRDKANKGQNDVIQRDCVIKTATLEAEAPGVQSVTFGDGIAGGGWGSESIVVYSGPLVFLSTNAPPSAPRFANSGAFYHLSKSLTTGEAVDRKLEQVSPVLPIPLEVKWTACAGRPDGTRALCACLQATGSVLVLGLASSSVHHNQNQATAQALTFSCLFLVPLAGPACPLGFNPRVHWAETNCSEQGRSVDLLHVLTPTTSPAGWVVPVPKQHAPSGQCLLLSEVYPLSTTGTLGLGDHGSDRGGTAGGGSGGVGAGFEPVATVAINGMLVLMTCPSPVAVKVCKASAACAMRACAQAGHADQAARWSKSLQGTIQHSVITLYSPQ